MSAGFERRAIGFTVYGHLDDDLFQEDLDRAMRRAPAGSHLVEVLIVDSPVDYGFGVLIVDAPAEDAP